VKIKFLIPFLLTVASLWGQTGTGGLIISTPSSGNPAPCVTNVTPPVGGIQGGAFSYQYTAGCSTAAPFTWTAAPNPPVNGLTLTGGGLLSGTLGTPGTYNYCVTVTDTNLLTGSKCDSVAIGIPTPPNIDSGVPPGGVAGTLYDFVPHVSGNNPPFTWSIIGSLPTGVTLFSSSTGEIKGTPTTAGTFSWRYHVVDNIGGTTDSNGGVNYSTVVTWPQPQFSNGPPSGGNTGDVVNFPFTACCGTAPYSFVALGTAPPGTSVSGAGVWSGTLGAAGSYTLTVQITDAHGQTAIAQYTILIVGPLAGGTLPNLPISWVNNHECDGTTSHTIAFPADGLGMHGGTAYAMTLAGLQSALNDANTKRDADGSGTLVSLPHGQVFASLATLVIPGPNTTTGLNSSNCIIVDSDTPLPNDQTVCSHGVRDPLRSPGCPTDKGSMWVLSNTSTATASVVSCNTPGTQGPPHHWEIKDGEIRYDSTGPVGGSSAVALVWCGTNNETSEAQQPNHMHFVQDYWHGYDTPNISAARGIFFSMHDSSIDYNYMEQLHLENKQGECVASQQSSRIKIVHNWIEGCSEGVFSGGAPPLIAGYNPSDWEIRGNRITLDPTWVTQSSGSVSPRPHLWNIANRLEFKNMVRAVIDGNILDYSWNDQQAGWLMLLNVRPTSTNCNPCTNGGNNTKIFDITVTNDVFAHAAQAIQTDASSCGTGSNSQCGHGEGLKSDRWLMRNLMIHDIGDNTRFPNGCPQVGCLHTPPYNPYTAVVLQLGASGQTLSCTVARDGAGLIATVTCTAQLNVPGTGLYVGDPVKMSGCTDSSFNVGNTSLGPPILSGSPGSLVFTFANTGTANATATGCLLDNSAGYPHNVTVDHWTVIGANTNSMWIATEGQSPSLQYPRNIAITNSIFASNGGNPGGLSATGKAEGLPVEQLFDTSTFHFNCNVLTGRKSSLYTLFQTGECANFFPGNNVGGANNQTGIVCSGGTPDATCVGFASLMNGAPFVTAFAEYHQYNLMLTSTFAKGQVNQASDGTSRGADIPAIDRAIDATIYTCATYCGTGPFPDTGGVFMVPTAGDNAHNCTIDKPCDSFAAAKTAVQLLPVGSKTIMLHGGTYPVTSTINLTSADSGDAMEDMVNWLCAPYAFRTTSHTSDPGFYNGCYLDTDGHKIWEIKNSAGHPWDVVYYDDVSIYHWLTENGDIIGGFNNAFAYKRFVNPAPVAPRFYRLGTKVYRESKGASGSTNGSFRTANCELDAPAETFLGDVRGVTTTINSFDYGEDVGPQQTILVQYLYSGHAGDFGNQERYYYTKNFGWMRWDHAACSGSCDENTPYGSTPGTWIIDNTATHSLITAGGTGTPNFPCGTAQPWWIGGTNVAAGQATAPGAPAVPVEQVTWTNYPGETPVLSGAVRVTGFTNSGSCGTNCQDWVATLPLTYQRFENLWYGGVRRPRPQSVGATPVHGFAPNACPTSAGADAFLCVTAASQALANVACGCASGVNCAGSQTRACTTGWQCFNKFKVTSGDVSGTWHGLPLGDVEILDFETWTMARMRVKTVAGGNVTFTGPTANTNDHGCQGGHFYVSENVKEAAAKGQWYLDRDTDNNGVDDLTQGPQVPYKLHFYADSGLGENPNTGIVEVPQLSTASPQVLAGTGVSNVTFEGLTFKGDNFVPDTTSGLGDQQGQPSVSSLTSFTSSNYIMFDTDIWQQASGWALTFQAGGTHNTIQNSHCSDTGGGCFRFGTSVSGKMAAQDVDTDLNVPQYGTVFNNLCDHTQRVQPSGYGGCFFLGDGHHFSVTHNESGWSYTGGIELGFGLGLSSTGTKYFTHDNDIGYNLIYGDPNALMTDFGGIYIAATLSSACPTGTPLNGNPCNRIHNNYIHDMYSNYDMSSSAASSGGRGIYCDQGCSHELIQNNLIVRTGHSAIYHNQPQISGSPHYNDQNDLIDNNIFAYCSYANAGFTANLPGACIARNGDNAAAFTATHNISYFHTPSGTLHFQNLAGSWHCVGGFWVGYVGAGTSSTVAVNSVTQQITFTSSVGGAENFSLSYAGQTIAQLITAINAHSAYSAGSTSDITTSAASNLVTVSATSIFNTVYADENNNFMTACSLHFDFHNNSYYQFDAPNTMIFAQCKTSTCTTPFNSTNDFIYSANGGLPACWTNAWSLNGCASPAGPTAGEDAASVFQNPGFTNPGFAGGDDYHYSHNYSGQGIVPFDYTLAGRMPTNTFGYNTTVPEMFPVRPVNPATDF
jgi:hypothetical protein